MIKIKNYINGELVAPHSGKYIDNYDPATGQIYAQIPNSEAVDVQNAIRAAQAAFPIWSKMTIAQRSKIILKLSFLIEENIPALAAAESQDNGKPLTLATKVDIPRAAANFHFYATAIHHYSTDANAMSDKAINYTLREPIGVVGCISPWNLPLYLFSWKIAPALAAGNCVVAKPSEVTPMTAYLLSQLCIEAGFPAGVLNIVHGYGHLAGNEIVSNPAVKAISFTGGTATGAAIAKIAAPMFKKLSLELGGKNPNIIFADCDYNKMLATTLRSSFANQGQICLCGSRIFVERPIYEKFKKDFVAQTKQLIVGDPAQKETKIGAIVSKAHQQKILSYIELAQQEGGTILAGGQAVQLDGRCEQGYFVAPTIIEGLAYDCRTNQEEIFGPVVTIMPFDTEEEVLQYANSVKYGLACSLWTSNISRATSLAQQIQAGIVWVNCWLLRDLRTPFGGVKASGVGREGGFHALDFFTEPKNICISY